MSSSLTSRVRVCEKHNNNNNNNSSSSSSIGGSEANTNSATTTTAAAHVAASEDHRVPSPLLRKRKRKPQRQGRRGRPFVSILVLLTLSSIYVQTPHYMIHSDLIEEKGDDEVGMLLESNTPAQLPVYTVSRMDCKVVPAKQTSSVGRWEYLGGGGGEQQQQQHQHHPLPPPSTTTRKSTLSSRVVVSEYARALGHLRTMHKILREGSDEADAEFIDDDATEEPADAGAIPNHRVDDDVVMILERPGLDGRGASGRGDVRGYLSGRFLNYGWKALVDSAPLDWRVLTLPLNSPVEHHDDDETRPNSIPADTIVSNTTTIEAMLAIRASNIYRKGNGDLWMSWSPFYEGGLKSYLVSRREMKRILRLSGYEDGYDYDEDEAKALFQVESPENKLVHPNRDNDNDNDNDSPKATGEKAANHKNYLNVLRSGLQTPVLAEELLLYNLVGGSAVYASTLPPLTGSSRSSNSNNAIHNPFYRGNDKRRTSVRKKHSKQKQALVPSLLVLTSIQITSMEMLHRHVDWLRTDANELARVHTKENGGLPLWKVNVLVTIDDDIHLMEAAKEAFRNISIVVGHVPKIDANIRCTFYTIKSRSKDGMSVASHNWLRMNESYFSEFDKVLWKESHQRIAGMAWMTFLEQSQGAIISAPLREDLDASRMHNRWKSQPIRELQARSWMGQVGSSGRSFGIDDDIEDIEGMDDDFHDPFDDEASEVWHMDQFYNVRSLEVPLLERNLVLMDARFVEWYFGLNKTEPGKPGGTPGSGSNVPNTVESVWCKDAGIYLENTSQDDYGSNHRDVIAPRKHGSQELSISCLLVLLTSIHEQPIQDIKDRGTNITTTTNNNNNLGFQGIYKFMDDKNHLKEHCEPPPPSLPSTGKYQSRKWLPVSRNENNEEALFLPPYRCVDKSMY